MPKHLMAWEVLDEPDHIPKTALRCTPPGIKKEVGKAQDNLAKGCHGGDGGLLSKSLTWVKNQHVAKDRTKIMESNHHSLMSHRDDSRGL